MLKLVAEKVVSEDLSSKDFYNYYLVYEKDGKSRRLRVRPVFWSDLGFLRQLAQDLEQ